MFINRKLVVQESLGYITSILSSQIRVYPLKGYCSENNFKIYKSIAFKNNFGVATFCFKGKIIQHDGSMSIEYFIRPSLSTLLFILIQFIGLTYLLYLQIITQNYFWVIIMKLKDSWSRFLKSGKVTDYLYFVNSSKEEGSRVGTREPLYCGSTCEKGNEDRGERPTGYSL